MSEFCDRYGVLWIHRSELHQTGERQEPLFLCKFKEETGPSELTTFNSQWQPPQRITQHTSMCIIFREMEKKGIGHSICLLGEVLCDSWFLSLAVCWIALLQWLFLAVKLTIPGMNYNPEMEGILVIQTLRQGDNKPMILILKLNDTPLIWATPSSGRTTEEQHCVNPWFFFIYLLTFDLLVSLFFLRAVESTSSGTSIYRTRSLMELSSYCILELLINS